MDCLVMCGGQGTRLGTAAEKPLFEVAGRPLVDRVVAAARESRVNDVYAVTSPHTPATRSALDGRVSCIEAPGDGYVEDLQYALDAGVLADGPVLTLAADLPLLDGAALDSVLAVYDTGSLAVCVPAAVPEALGITVDAAFQVDGQPVVPTGVNVVGGAPDDTWVSRNVRFAVNVNYPGDAAVAERLLGGPSQ